MRSPESAFAAALAVTSDSAISVCLCSGVRLYREGVAESLSRYRQVDVVGVLGDGGDALPRLRELRPRVILLDITFPGSKELLRAIVREVPDSSTVALALGETESEIVDWAEAGVSGYVTRDASVVELVAVIERVCEGEVLCSPKVAGSLFRRVSALAADGRVAPARAVLTARERQVVELIDEGLSNKEIAARLFIELATVKNHVHNSLAKLNVARRGEAAARIRAERGI